MYKAIINRENGKVLRFEPSSGAPYETLVDVPANTKLLFYIDGEFVDGEAEDLNFAQRRIYDLIQKGELTEGELSELNLLIEREKQKCDEDYIKQAWELEKDATYKHEHSVCLIIRDENKYLDEWITYHLGIGFDHFYIYDNLSKVPVKDFIQGKEYADKVTVIRWKGEVYPQRKAYAHFLAEYGKETKWCLFIDTDEFLHITKEGVSTVGELLADYPEVAAIFFTWQQYNANGHEHYEDKPVMERFTQKCGNKEWYDGKCIIRPKFVAEQHVHSCSPYYGFAFVDTHHHRKDYKGRNHQRDVAVIDHFFTRSYEEWLEKIERGSSDRNCLKKYNDFFDYNPDMVYLYDEARALDYQKYDYAPTDKDNKNIKPEEEDN